MRRPCRSRTHRSRSGFTLIELVILIGCTTIILSTCGVFLHLLLKIDHSGRDVQRDTLAVSRLARQFRSDVRGATKAEAPGPTRLELSGNSGGRVIYEIDKLRITRTESRAKGAERHEAYVLRRYVTPRFEVGTDQRVSLVLPRSPGSASTLASLGIRIETTLGRDASRRAAALGDAR
ncbi:MAG: hypothetical protein U0794_07715 [Isosphaeraceae bacterium]